MSRDSRFCKKTSCDLPEQGNSGWCRYHRPGFFQRLWRRYLARFRLNLQVVCEESRGRGPLEDFHDYPDSREKVPMHFHTYRCERCGKEFGI